MPPANRQDLNPAVAMSRTELGIKRLEVCGARVNRLERFSQHIDVVYKVDALHAAPCQCGPRMGLKLDLPEAQTLSNTVGDQYEMLNLTALSLADFHVVVVLNLLLLSLADLLFRLGRAFPVALKQGRNLSLERRMPILCLALRVLAVPSDIVARVSGSGWCGSALEDLLLALV